MDDGTQSLYELFLLKGETIDVSAGTKLIEAGQKVHNVFLLVKGELILENLNLPIGDKEFAGIREYIMGIPATYSVTATRNTRLLMLAGTDFDKWYKSSFGKPVIAAYLLAEFEKVTCSFE